MVECEREVSQLDPKIGVWMKRNGTEVDMAHLVLEN